MVRRDRRNPDARADERLAGQPRGARLAHEDDPSADEASRLIEAAMPQIAAMKWSASDIRPMMIALTDEHDSILRSDVHSAEQVALSLQTLATVLTRNDRRTASGPMMKATDALFAKLKDRG